MFVLSVSLPHSYFGYTAGGTSRPFLLKEREREESSRVIQRVCEEKEWE